MKCRGLRGNLLCHGERERGKLGLLDDEVSTRTRGVALQFADQFNAHNQLQGFGSYTYSNDLRWYNSTPYDDGFTIQLRSTNGGCYDVSTGAAANCYDGTAYNASTLATGGPIASASSVPHNLAVPAGAPVGTLLHLLPFQCTMSALLPVPVPTSSRAPSGGSKAKSIRSGASSLVHRPRKTSYAAPSLA